MSSACDLLSFVVDQSAIAEKHNPNKQAGQDNSVRCQHIIQAESKRGNPRKFGAKVQCPK